MFEESIANVASAFVQLDGVWYAPASELMELFAGYSSVVMGVAMMVIIAICVFVLLAYEPISRFASWLAKKITGEISK